VILEVDGASLTLHVELDQDGSPLVVGLDLLGAVPLAEFGRAIDRAVPAVERAVGAIRQTGVNPALLFGSTEAERDSVERYSQAMRQEGPRRRRTRDDRLLHEVADIYRDDRSGAPTRAVQTALGTSHRNAVRWVQMAREKGFLPPVGHEAGGQEAATP
jgi:hypothetical protein